MANTVIAWRMPSKSQRWVAHSVIPGQPQGWTRNLEIPDAPAAVMPRACGASSTPRLIRSITNASGILDRPVEPDDDG